MRYSFSRVDCFKTCPYQFKLRYIDKIQTLPEWNDAANPLIIGSALHHGIEKGVDEAIDEYFNGFPVITDRHIEEAMKLRALIPKVKALIKDTAEFEVVIEDKGRFIGYIDYLDVENSIILDFKYTTKKNFEEKYLKSPQVHIYKWYLKELTGVDIQKIGYIHVPKISIRQKKTEDLIAFRKRLNEELEKAEPSIGWVRYSDEKVDEFLELMEQIDVTEEFPKKESRLCDFCDYKDFCKDGNDWLIDWWSTPYKNKEDYEEKHKQVCS